MTRSVNARISGLYKHALRDRGRLVCDAAAAGESVRAYLSRGGGLDLESADRMSENVVATFGLPFSVATNFLVNGKEFLVPMSVEEPSVVAAASNAARMVRASGGFFTDSDPSVMTAQVQLDDVPDVERAAALLRLERERLFAVGDRSIPKMVERGGGCRDMEVRVLSVEHGVLVVDLFVAVGDAMGANTVDTVAEAVAPVVQSLVHGTIGLRILSNLPLRRLVRARCEVDAESLGGPAVADGLARASRFADLDVLRAVTHNKGFMNGVDAAAVSLGQDWRSIEAGAHAYCAISGRYQPISTWRRTERGLEGRCELPLAVGTVGGSTTAHQGVRAAFELLQVEGARELAGVLASVGLASNLAALRALASEGIQQGHMKLHHRKSEAHASLTASPANGAAVHVAHSEVQQ
jgi:hydroxymethylglutaryl-CoA reductase